MITFWGWVGRNMSEPTYLVLGVDLRDHIITQQVKTTLLAVSLLTVFTAQTSLFHVEQGDEDPLVCLI